MVAQNSYTKFFALHPSRLTYKSGGAPCFPMHCTLRLRNRCCHSYGETDILGKNMSPQMFLPFYSYKSDYNQIRIASV